MGKYEIGSIISFGGYDWRVLDMKENAALIITEEIIEQHPYNDKYVDITWAECSLRKYLNGEFYERFAENDRKRIIPTHNETPDNEWYGTEGGEDTTDYVFLLSIEEVVCKYFGDSSYNLYNSTKKQRYWFSRKDENNVRRSTRLAIGCRWNWWWWLRSPGRLRNKGAYVHGDGNIGIQGNNILKGNISDGMCTGGLRPAMWVEI